jgi:formate hydrogenlyase transcriptional activator
VSGAVQKGAETVLTERYEALLRVSQTLISVRSSEELFNILARELRAVMNFYVMGVGIYDEKVHEMPTKSYGEPGVPFQARKFAPEETFSWWVYQHQQPLVIPSLDSETRFPAVTEMLRNRGVRSVCVLPLTTVHRRLGGLAVGSTEADAYSSEEVRFLSLVANQVALAVDDKLNFDAARVATEALQSSEQRLRLILDSLPGLVSTRGATGAPEFVNRQMLDFFGSSLDQLPDWTSLIHPDDRDQVIARWRHSVETGQPYDVEHRARRSDGEYRWIHARGQPLRDAEGNIVRWCNMLTDVDDRRRAEEALRASEQNFRLILDSIPGLVNTTTAAGEFEFVNQQSLDYSGMTLDELKNWVTTDVVHPDDVSLLMTAWKHSVETGHPHDAEYRIRRADGVYRWFNVRSLPWRDTEGRIIRWYTLRTDIDKRKQAEDRLQLLLDITNRLVSNLQLRDLLRAISASVRRVMQCDLVGVFLPDADGSRMQTFLDFPESKGFIQEDYCSMEGSLGGFVFGTGKPWIGNAADVLPLGLTEEPAIPEGLKTGCFVPLVSRNRCIGLLGLGRREENAFSQADIGFLTQVATQIAIGVENALEYEQITEARDRLAEQTFYLENEIRLEHNFEEIIGNSQRLKAVLESVRIVAPADSTVLIQGETGTGKEVIARAIHNLSSRKDQAFVKVNCAAIPLGLLESELFGHERGSFTGAIAQRIGRFELAHKGTLFLDEVGDIPLELQPKLLRVLQEQEFERLGSTRTQRVDVRVLAATNTSLTQMVAEKKFRSDLYYRLKVFPIDVPPLRERRDDIPLLVRYFANKFARRMGKQIESIPNETMDALSRYSWPGNIRELQNLMERAALLSSGPSLRVPLADILNDSSPGAAGGGNALEQAEREQIIRALCESNWVVGGAQGAATRLGLKRTSLAYKIQKFGISRPPQ